MNQVKNDLIDLILATKNEELLLAVSSMLTAVSTEKNNTVALSSEQIEMLLMSEKDIKNGDITSEENLNESDSKWLN